MLKLKAYVSEACNWLIFPTRISMPSVIVAVQTGLITADTGVNIAIATASLVSVVFMVKVGIHGCPARKTPEPHLQSEAADKQSSPPPKIYEIRAKQINVAAANSNLPSSSLIHSYQPQARTSSRATRQRNP